MIDRPEWEQEAYDCHKNMKVAACLHFGGFQSSYALHVGWHERLRILARYGVQFDALVNEKCKEGLYPNQVNCLPNPGTGNKSFQERAQIFENYYKAELGKYDVVLTADMIYQRKGNFLAMNAAMREASKELPNTWWCHWIHSGWTHRDNTLKFPENLRYQMPPKSFLVYLNSFELGELAGMFDTDLCMCNVVHNPKDIRSFHEMDPKVWEISDILDFPNKDVIQLFPFCTTRMDAKGINGVIGITAACKRKGKNVALVLANANSKSRTAEIFEKKMYMKHMGLVDRQDYLWTSDINNHKPLSRKAVADIFRMSNLFTFLSWRETAGNVFQEAMISDVQLILNQHLPCLQEMAPRDAVFMAADHKTPGVRDGEPGDMQTIGYSTSEQIYHDEIVTHALRKTRDLKHQWKFSLDHIWLNQFEPLLRKAYLAAKGRQWSLVRPLPRWDGPVSVPPELAVRGINEQFGTDSSGAPITPLPLVTC